MSTDAPYDVWWEADSVDVDTPEEAAREAVTRLRAELASGSIHFVYRQPDVSDDDFEITVNLPDDDLFVNLFRAVAACEAPEGTQVDDVLAQYQAHFDRITGHNG